MAMIRDATTADAGPITAIYNHAVRTGTAIWNDRIVDEDDRSQWIADRQADGFPVLVCVDDTGGDDIGAVTGYATYGPFRPHDGFRHTVELSLYVDEQRRGQGIGRTLLARLIERACQDRVHVMVAAIEANNVASIALHTAHGFHATGTLPQVGAKFGRWLDLALMTRVLDTASAPPPPKTDTPKTDATG